MCKIPPHTRNYAFVHGIPGKTKRPKGRLASAAPPVDPGHLNSVRSPTGGMAIAPENAVSLELFVACWHLQHLPKGNGSEYTKIRRHVKNTGKRGNTEKSDSCGPCNCKSAPWESKCFGKLVRVFEAFFALQRRF